MILATRLCRSSACIFPAVAGAPFISTYAWACFKRDRCGVRGCGQPFVRDVVNATARRNAKRHHRLAVVIGQSEIAHRDYVHSDKQTVASAQLSESHFQLRYSHSARQLRYWGTIFSPWTPLVFTMPIGCNPAGVGASAEMHWDRYGLRKRMALLQMPCSPLEEKCAWLLPLSSPARLISTPNFAHAVTGSANQARASRSRRLRSCNRCSSIRRQERSRKSMQQSPAPAIW